MYIQHTYYFHFKNDLLNGVHSIGSATVAASNGRKKHELSISSIKLPHVILLTSTYILLAQMARKIHHRIKLLASFNGQHLVGPTCCDLNKYMYSVHSVDTNKKSQLMAASSF